jgi:hypothetical protein
MSRPAPEVLRQVTGHVRRRRRRRVLRGSSRAATVLPARSTFPSLPHSYSSVSVSEPSLRVITIPRLTRFLFQVATDNCIMVFLFLIFVSGYSTFFSLRRLHF